MPDSKDITVISIIAQLKLLKPEMLEFGKQKRFN